MEFLTVAAAVAVLAVVVAYCFISRPTTQSSSWPKDKQSQAYTRKVIPKKRKIQLPLNSLGDFLPVGGITTIHGVPGFFGRHGNKFSVYSIDWEQEMVVLIRPVDGVDLKRHPFFREAQRRNAAEVLCIPIAQLHAVADTIANEVAHVKQVFVFMTARCGSTLLTRLAEATFVAQGVNEPDVFSNISMAVHRVRVSSHKCQAPAHPSCCAVLLTEEDAVVLLRNVITLLNYYLVMSDPSHRSVIFYKLKPDVILNADLMAHAFPSAQTVFMYRNGLEVFESLCRVIFQRKYVPYAAFRFFVRLGLFKHAPSVLPDYVRCFGDDENSKFSGSRYRGSPMFYYVTMWAGVMQRATDLQKKHPGYFFHAILNYAALTNEKEKTLRLLMRTLGVKWSPEDQGEDRQKMEKALVEDSQAGTRMSARKKPGEKWFKDNSSRWCGHWEREYIREVCGHAGDDISGPDFVFPGSML